MVAQFRQNYFWTIAVQPIIVATGKASMGEGVSRQDCHNSVHSFCAITRFFRFKTIF